MTRLLAAALLGAYGAVNAVSLYVERGRETFDAVHVEQPVYVEDVAEGLRECCAAQEALLLWIPNRSSTSQSDRSAQRCVSLLGSIS
jgi:hypothetical protein